MTQTTPDTPDIDILDNGWSLNIVIKDVIINKTIQISTYGQIVIHPITLILE